MSSTTSRILIVDSSALMREGIERRLTCTGHQVVAAVADIDAAEAAYAEHTPDLVLCDHTIGGGTGLALLRRLRARFDGVRMLILSAADDKALITAYLNEGAVGFMHKSVAVPEFVHCVGSALAGHRALDTLATARVLESLHDPAPGTPSSSLSRREVEVLALVAQGHTNDDIAGRLFISPQTVKTHLSRIFNKLGVRDRASAAVRATRDGLLD